MCSSIAYRGAEQCLLIELSILLMTYSIFHVFSHIFYPSENNSNISDLLEALTH